MPCRRPPATVFFTTTAKLGPGDIAPAKQIDPMVSQVVVSNASA